MVAVERSRTGSHRWELDFCPKCRERTTFWYVDDSRTRCANCGVEKEKSRGLLGGPDDDLRVRGPASDDPGTDDTRPDDTRPDDTR
jgi:hypothetical protein